MPADPPRLAACSASPSSARIGTPTPLYFAGADEVLDLPGHVRAGSGVRRWAGKLVVVQDDVNALALVDELTGSVTPLLLPPTSEGLRRFCEQRGNKAAKLDLEACLVLPDGRLVAFGSDSTAARERVVVVDPEHRVRVVDGAAFYAGLRAEPAFAGSELNIEGAIVVGSRIRLFQRGNGAAAGGVAPVHAVGDLELEDVVDWIDRAAHAPRLCAVLGVDLGELGGVPLGFTDAATLPDGRAVFLAAAEDSPDTYRDGQVLGARIGLLDGDHCLLAEILDEDGRSTELKLEGIDLIGTTASGALEFVVVADMDDPELPAVVARLVWDPR
jgi:hypothetical protein